MLVVISRMSFRSFPDASDYQDQLVDEGGFEAEIWRQKDGSTIVTTVVRATDREEAEEIAEQLRQFTHPDGSLIVGVRDITSDQPREEDEEDEPDTLVDEVEEIPLPLTIPRPESQTRRDYRRAYQQSENFRIAQRKYQQSLLGREAQRRWEHSDQGQTARDRYFASEKGVARRKEYQQRTAIERKLFSTTDAVPEGPYEELLLAVESETRDPSRFIGAEAIFAIQNASGVTKKQAHLIFDELRKAGFFIEVRKR